MADLNDIVEIFELLVSAVVSCNSSGIEVVVSSSSGVVFVRHFFSFTGKHFMTHAISSPLTFLTTTRPLLSVTSSFISFVSFELNALLFASAYYKCMKCFNAFLETFLTTCFSGQW